jgi:hypothetical protein
MQYIWEFIPHRAKFIKRAEIPTNEAFTRLFQAVSDIDRHQVILLGLSAFYVLNTETWQWTICDNKIKAPINVPNYATNNLVFSYSNDSLFCGSLPFDGSLERITTASPKKVKVNFPWVNAAVLHNGDYYFINTTQSGNDFQRILMKLCMTKKEFVEVGSLNKRTLKLRGSFTFGFVRENQLYFISDANEMLVVTQFEDTDKLQFSAVDLPETPFLPPLARPGHRVYHEALCYYAFDGTNLILFNKLKMTFLKLDLNTKTWDQPITFEDYPPKLQDHDGGQWVPWKNTGILISCESQLDTVFLFDAKTWTWTAKPCHGATRMFCEGTKDAIYHGPTLKFSSVHAAVHEDKLYVCGTTVAGIFSFNEIEIHCLDLKTWTWSPIENREYRMKEVSSIVIAQNTLYLLNASLQEEWCDWLALNLKTNKWTKKPGKHDAPNLTKDFQAAYMASKACIYLIQNSDLATMSIADNNIERIPAAVIGNNKQLIPWDDDFLVVIDQLTSERGPQTKTDPIRFFDTTNNRFREIVMQGDDAYLYGHSSATQLNDDLFILGKNANSIIRLYKDVPVKSLQHLATTALCGYLDMDNVFTLLDYSVNLRNRVLQQGCIAYLKNNTLKLMQAVEQINQLSDEIKDILSVNFTYLPIKMNPGPA